MDINKYLGMVLATKFPQGGFVVKDDGAGPYLDYWNVEMLGPRPTESMLASWIADNLPEQQLTPFTTAIQAHLDSFARTRNYDGIMSATTYATSKVARFQLEGQYAVEARDNTWAVGYKIMDDVLQGKRPMPTLEEVVAELPILAWPELTHKQAEGA